MTLQPVQSSNLAKVGYENGTLVVEFKNGETYEYNTVPQEHYLNMLSAGSIGNYFNTYIKTSFPTKKVTGVVSTDNQDISGWKIASDAKDSYEVLWRGQFDERQRKQIDFARLYAKDFAHGANGHNDMLIIAKMADLLDKANQ